MYVSRRSFSLFQVPRPDTTTEHMPFSPFPLFSNPFHHLTREASAGDESIRTSSLRQDPWFKDTYLSLKNINGLKAALFFRFDQKMFFSSLCHWLLNLAAVIATPLEGSSEPNQRSTCQTIISQVRDDWICFTLRVLVLQTVYKILLCSTAGMCMPAIFK